MNNKRGQITFLVFLGLFAFAAIALVLFFVGTITLKFGSSLDQNINIGQVNLHTTYDNTFGQFTTMVLNHADLWGVMFIFGMIIGLFLAAYFLRNTGSKVFMVVDIFILLASFVVSVYVRAIYSKTIIAFESAGQTFTSAYLPHTSFFVLNLPIFVAIIGVIAMILIYAGIPAKADEVNTIANITAG